MSPVPTGPAPNTPAATDPEQSTAAQSVPAGPVPSGVSITCGTRTDVGLKRSVNEDSLLAEWPVFLVADGMGGHHAGDVASAAVIAEFRKLVGRTLELPDVASALDRAHKAVRTIAAHVARGAGSTLTGVVQLEHEGQPHWLVLNVGDSRVYRMFSTELRQLTTDHSMLQELLDDGRMTAAERDGFARKNVITRAVGAENSPTDYWLHPVVTGERVLVCSDGLTGELPDEAIRARLTLGGAPQQTADLLLGQALERGGRDNITLIVVDVIAGGAGAEHADSSALFDSISQTIDSRHEDTIELAGRAGRGV